MVLPGSRDMEHEASTSTPEGSCLESHGSSMELGAESIPGKITMERYACLLI